MSNTQLVLTRDFGSSIILKTKSEEITFKVIEKSNSQVRVLIQAPKEVIIAREEVYKGDK